MIATPPNPNFGKGIAGLALLAAVLLLVVLMGLMRVGGLSEAVSPMPPRASDPAPNGDDPQTASVRSKVVEQGYEQPYGAQDQVIAKNLGIKGRSADVVGYHRSLDRWLIAESKGGDMDGALQQLRNALNGLRASVKLQPDQVNLRIYTNAHQFAKFSEADGLSGWRLQNSYLGYRDAGTQHWIFAEIDGLRILVLPAP